MADDLIKIEKWGDLAKLYKGGGVPMPFVQELFLLDCEIAGTGFVKDIRARAEALAEGVIVSLVREPENKYDKNAIRVDNADEKKLGYIPRHQNGILARLLDGGKLLYGKVDWIDISESRVNIGIRIYLKDL